MAESTKTKTTTKPVTKPIKKKVEEPQNATDSETDDVPVQTKKKQVEIQKDKIGTTKVTQNQSKTITKPSTDQKLKPKPKPKPEPEPEPEPKQKKHTTSKPKTTATTEKINQKNKIHDDESSIGSQKQTLEDEIEMLVRNGLSLQKIAEQLGKSEQNIRFALRKMIYSGDDILKKKVENLMEGKTNEAVKFNTDKLYTDPLLCNMLTLCTFLEKNSNDPKTKDLYHQVKNECMSKISSV